jgi:hypothetical protein
MNRMIVGNRKALSNWARQFKTVIDLEKKVYKIQEGLFGLFTWGDFKPLPKINYVLIFKSFFAKCEACTIDDFDDNANSYFQISLVYQNNRRIIVHETKNKQEAFSFAKEIASGLETPLKDSASNKRQSVWLK